jgi:membrane protease YdiL (CAAX protease family)
LKRWIELGLLFGVAPWLISLGPRWWILPAILGGGIVCLLMLLADPTFPRRRLLDGAAARRGLGGLLLRTAAVWAGVLLVALIQRGPDGLFLVPRARPGLWLLVLALYPIFSAYPQEIMFRTFFFHRYAALFRRPATMIVANAVLFGWAHVIVHSLTAMLLTTAGGLIFGYIYHRYRSTLLVGAEHALYGDFVFTVGIGGMFVNGVRLLSKVVG